MKTHTVISTEQAQRIANTITGLPLPFTMTWTEGNKRSLNQNALLHKWLGEIAKQQGDTAADVKGRCHVAYGVPIRMRDPVWARVWNAMCADKTYEQQCFMFAMGFLSMTRDMSVKELSEYMKAAHRDYTAQGVRLSVPEEPTDG